MAFATGDVLSATFMNSAVVGKFLGLTSSSSTFTHTSGGATTMLTLNVTIPSGLHTSMSIMLIGLIAHLSTPGGVGATVAISNATTSGENPVPQGSFSGGLTVIKTDLNPSPGSRAYTFSLATTVGGSTVTARTPTLLAVVA